MNKLIISFISLFIVVLFTADASAIPAFARKYNMSCNVCHTVFPKLKPYGEEFAANGFQIPDKEPQRFFKKTGDDLLSLMRELPLALRFELYGTYENNSPTSVDFKTPYFLKLMSGGNIYKDISYYLYFYLAEKGEIAGLEDAFLMFNDVVSKKVDLDLYVGQFQVSDPLFKRELRLEQEDYKIYTSTPGISLANLKYDRGLMFTYGAPTKTDLAVEVVNGSGIHTTDIFDVDKYKNVLVRASQEVLPFLRIGGFGYYGKEQPVADSSANEMYMLGADLTAGNEYVELNAQYVYRSDINPYGLAVKPGERVKTQGGFAELIVSPNGIDSRLTGHLLYNYVDSDDSNLNYQSYTGGLSYLISRNLRVVGEYTYVKEYKDSKVTVGFITAF